MILCFHSEAMSLIKETPRVFNYGLGQVSGDLNYHDVDSIHSSTGILSRFAPLKPYDIVENR